MCIPAISFGRRWPLPVLALASAAAGRLDEAEAQAREAVQILSTTDLIQFHAEALVTLGDVLRAGGHLPEADVVFRQALDLYRQKGSLVGAETVGARLAT
jgi:Flp pilus assembly protein TadD